MKKIIALLVVLVAVLFLLFKVGVDSVIQSIPSDALVVFTKTGCPHCHHAMAFIDTTVRRDYPDLKIEILNVDKEENLNKLKALIHRHHINPKRAGTPMILINGQVLIGWDERRGQELLTLIRSFSAKRS